MSDKPEPRLGTGGKLLIGFLVGVGVGMILIASIDGSDPSGEALAPTTTSTTETPPTTTTTEPEPETLSFPTSWEEGEILLTVTGMRMLGPDLSEIGLSGVGAHEGYQFVGVRGIFENLAHEEKSGQAVRDQSPSVALRLITDRDNMYERNAAGGGDYIAGLSWSTDLKPQEAVENWAAFEIRNDEQPVRLEGLIYEDASDTWRLRYLWQLSPSR